jgi:hypothetical protein
MTEHNASTTPSQDTNGETLKPLAKLFSDSDDKWIYGSLFAINFCSLMLFLTLGIVIGVNL